MNEQKTILLVEDEALIAVTEKQTLKKHGFNAIVAHSGEKAIEVARTTPDIDLILMDINLGQGRMDGTEAAQIILKEKEIPVLFLSSYTQDEVVQKTERITSYGYVVKDSGETVLITSIKMAFKLYDAYMKVKDREESLQASEEKYRLIVETTSEGIVVLDKDSAIVFINPRMASMLGYAAEEMIGKSFSDLIPKDGLEDFYNRMEKRKRGIPEQYERRLLCKDGSFLWTIVSATPIRDENGNFQGSFAMITDITERKQAEEALQQSESNLRRAQEIAHLGGWEYDTETGKIIWSDEAYRIFGFAPQEEEVTSNLLLSMTHPEDRDRVGKRASNVSDGSGHNDVEYRIIRRDGSIRHVHSRRYVSTTEEKPGKIFGMVQDITFRKQAEEALKASLREKEILVREIHHRVKNNLSVVVSLLNLQSNKIENKEQAAAFQESRDRIHSMALVHQKLYEKTDLSHPDMGHYMNDISSKLKDIYAPGRNIVIESNGKDVSLDINLAIPIGLILNELITNSLKYAFPDNREGLITLSLSLKDASYCLSVSDNGIGLPEEIRAGTLGMELIHLLTGQIEGTLDIQRDKGTQLTITFPCQDIEK